MRLTSPLFLRRLAIALVAASAYPAYACEPRPCIEADPTNPPVAVGTTAETELDWDGGPGSSVWVSVDGLQETQVSSNTQGLQLVPVTLGTTAAFRLYSSGKLRLLDSVEVTPRSQLIAPFKPKRRMAQLPTSLTIEPTLEAHGTFVKLDFITEQLTKPSIWISTNAAAGFSSAGLDVQSFAPHLGGAKNEHHKVLYNLSPGTLYYYLIMAKSDSGVYERSKGSFTTLSRVAKLTIGKVRIIDDSDSGSSGECGFGFFVNGGSGNPNGTQGVLPETFDTDDLRDCDSGEDVTINITRTIPSSASTAAFNAVVCDEDFDSPFAFNSAGARYAAPLVGDIDTEAWECTGKNATLLLGPKRPGEEEHHDSFQMNVFGDDLDYRVHYRVDVTYE